MTVYICVDGRVSTSGPSLLIYGYLHWCVLDAEYADSSFYDDQSQIYPTVEEQMRMARRVAQSLTSPANRHTRGHRMFMKRREKSVEWTVDETNRRRPSVDRVDTVDLYYNPTPWTATATWKPRATPHDPSPSVIVAPSPVPRLLAPRRVPESDEKARNFRCNLVVFCCLFLLQRGNH